MQDYVGMTPTTSPFLFQPYPFFVSLYVCETGASFLFYSIKHFKMDETQARPHAFLESLVQQVKDLEPDFPSPNDFQRLGVQAVQVPLAPENDKGLQFEPCFFRPHPDKLFQKHPLHAWELENDPQNIQYTETLKDYIKTLQ